MLHIAAQHCRRVVIASSTGPISLCLHELRLSFAQTYELNGVAYVSPQCVVVSLTIMSLVCISGTEVIPRSITKATHSVW